MSEHDFRDAAVAIVDGRHGAAIEFSHDPEGHRAEYDEVEARLREHPCVRCGGPVPRWPLANICDPCAKTAASGMTDDLTQAQRRALDWMESVGKASVKLVRKNGFQQRTMDALADKGLIERFYSTGATPAPSRPVYRSKR